MWKRSNSIIKFLMFQKEALKKLNFFHTKREANFQLYSLSNPGCHSWRFSDLKPLKIGVLYISRNTSGVLTFHETDSHQGFYRIKCFQLLTFTANWHGWILLDVETIQFHHLNPCTYEIPNELILRISSSIHFCDCSQFRIMTEN